MLKIGNLKTLNIKISTDQYVRYIYLIKIKERLSISHYVKSVIKTPTSTSPNLNQ